MADVSDERVSFGKLTRSHAQYGTASSANSRVDNTVTFITHTVQAGDTLQGIGVKYGVAVSDTGRLWGPVTCRGNPDAYMYIRSFLK